MAQFTLDEFSSTAVSDTHACTRCGEWEFDTADDLETHQDACENDSKRTYQCAHCGCIFTDYISRRETRGRQTFYCSRDCKHEGEKAGEWRNCAECDDEVWVPDCHLTSVGDYTIDNHFCDKECESAYKSRTWVGENHPAWNGGAVESTCEQCGKAYDVKPSKQKTSRFCSRDCQFQWRRENEGDYDSARVDVMCDWCGDTYVQRPKDRDKTEHNLCSEACFGEWFSEEQRGPNNPAWKGGKQLIARVRACMGDRSWNRIADGARAAADHECEQCGAEASDRKHPVHHIIPLATGGTHGDWNLMVLCDSCHGKIERFTESFTTPHLYELAD